MKKFIAFLLAVSCIATLTFAQVKKDDKPKTAAKKESAKPAEKSIKASTPVKKAETKEHLKKDGTPDKRFKENKETKPATGKHPTSTLIAIRE